MSIISGFNAHPDEEFHYKSSKYFNHHFIPPAVGELSNIESYSIYGRSYNDSLGIDYLILGKTGILFNRFLETLNIYLSTYNIYRFSQNFFLFSFLIYLLFVIKSNFNYIFLVYTIFISSQVFYIYSYINNDTIPFIISSIIVLLFIKPNRINLSNFFVFGILLGILFISKLNYLPIFLFILVLFIREFFPRMKFSKFSKIHFYKKNSQKYYFYILLVATLFLVSRVTLDLYINGTDKNVKIQETVEKLADPRFKRSTFEIDKHLTYSGLYLKEKGYSIYDVLFKMNWHKYTFKSFFGYYGYITIQLPYLVYIFYLLNSIFFLFTFVILPFAIGILHDFKKNRIEIVYNSLLLLIAFSPIALSISHSWLNDFQPQGKYLFPMLPMIGFIIYSKKRYINLNLFYASLYFFYILSFISFVFIGLNEIQKIN